MNFNLGGNAAVLRSLLIVVLSLSGAGVAAADWPQFRGPTGQGLFTGAQLPLQWSGKQNVVWKQPLPGRGWSSPIVQAGRIYLTTAVPGHNVAGKDQSLRALCLDADTGKIIWDREVFSQLGAKAPRIHTKNSHASPSPLTDGQRLFVHFGHQGTACLDLAGNILWKKTDLAYRPVHGNAGSPILVDNALVYSCDGGDQQFLIALESQTGKVLWKTPRNSPATKKFSFSTPLLITVKGQQQIVSPGSDVVCAFEAKSGQEVWRVRYDGYSVVPRPVFGHGLVFVCTGYETPSLLAIRPEGQGDVTNTHVAWSTRKAVPHNSSPLLVGTELFLVSDFGIASCLDAKTGKVHWQERVGGEFAASPLFACGRVYFQSEEGECVVVKADRQLVELARNLLDERTLASFAALEGTLFIRTEKHLYRIGTKD